LDQQRCLARGLEIDGDLAGFFSNEGRAPSSKSRVGGFERRLRPSFRKPRRKLTKFAILPRFGNSRNVEMTAIVSQLSFAWLTETRAGAAQEAERGEEALDQKSPRTISKTQKGRSLSTNREKPKQKRCSGNAKNRPAGTGRDFGVIWSRKEHSWPIVSFPVSWHVTPCQSTPSLSPSARISP
jgi:hypothetical protein